MTVKLFEQEGYDFMGAAFEVYNEQGPGMSEEIYQESLEIELELRAIPFHSKQELIPYYKGRPLKKRYIPDLMVFGGIIVELKAVQQLAPEHESQLLNYMFVTGTQVGYLVNFGNKEELEWKRFVISDRKKRRTAHRH